ncbi:MAG: ParB/RepB/Spo0J family partition protein [Clostridia bacterium]|nr:ParB/RepB/Spo0J family partition protein [Clostridia bacterium]
MSDKNLKMNLPSLDDLFTTQAERDEIKAEKIELIPIDKISDFPNHPFKVERDEKMEEMINSIKNEDIVHPVIVRPKEDGTYEMISGHRRKYASMLAGKNNIKAIVKNLTDDEATILMVDSNIQREQILPSEKAFAYKMKLDAMKHQGKRVNLEDNVTCAQDEHKLENLKSRDIVANDYGISREQLRRYIRLTYLIPELLEKVDNNYLGFTQAVELSYINQDNQYLINNQMDYYDISPSVSQAKSLRVLFEQGELNEELLEKTLGELKPNQVENQNIKYRDIRKYFPKDYTNEKINNVIHDLLESYYRKWHNKSRDAR